jgi:putative peptide zinc metalloprotease protein
VPVSHVANGDFEIRPGTLTEIHAPVAGFLKRIYRSEGDSVESGTAIAELEVPDLNSQITRKHAEIREVEATLKQLRMGPRPEEVAEQKAKVIRAEGWRDMAQRDLEQAKLVLQQELVRLDHQIQQSQTDVNYSVNSVNRAAKLYTVGAIAGEQYRSEYKRYEVSASQLAQAKAAKLAKQAEGVRAAEGEVARRDKELEDARSTLSLMQAGSRPEQIEAETARQHRLQEELKFLESQKAKLQVTAPAGGVIATPRMNDRIGQLAELGALICMVEDISSLNVEISVAEEDVPGVQPGQNIDLKVRALPFETFLATVDRIAPRAVITPEKRQAQNSVIVYCHVDNKDGRLKSGMTGLARIYRGQRPMGWNLVNQALRYVRTEFWW